MSYSMTGLFITMIYVYLECIQRTGSCCWYSLCSNKCMKHLQFPTLLGKYLAFFKKNKILYFLRILQEEQIALRQLWKLI